MGKKQKQLLDEEGKPVLLFGLPVYVDEDAPPLNHGDIELLPFDEGIERLVLYPNPLLEDKDEPRPAG